MKTSWSVEVLLSNGKALSIGTDYVSGSADLSDNDEHLIREAAKSLLAFVGEPPNQEVATDAGPCFVCGEVGSHGRNCPTFYGDMQRTAELEHYLKLRKDLNDGKSKCAIGYILSRHLP